MPTRINSSDGSQSDSGGDKNNPNPDDVSDDNIIVMEDDGTFDKVWEMYGKLVGNKETLREKWNLLPPADKDVAMLYIPAYVGSRPNLKYRKNFENFLT